MRAQRSQRGKEEVLTECPQIFAALMYEDDLQKLVKLLLVTTSKYCQRKGLPCMHRRIHLCRLGNCICDLINFIDACLS